MIVLDRSCSKNSFICVLFVGFALILAACSPDQSQATLRFSRWAGVEESRRFQVLVDAFQKDNPDIRIVTDYLPWGAYRDKLQLSLETGDAPDVFMMSSVQVDPFVKAGKLQALDEFDEYRLADQFSEALKAPVTQERHLYGMPVGLGLPVLFYNEALFREAGLDFPSETEPMDWDGFLDMLAALRKTGPDGQIIQYPLNISLSDLAECLLNAYGTPVYADPAAQFSLGFNVNRASLALETLSRMIRESLIPPPEWGDADHGFGTPDNALRTGKVALMYTGMWSLPLINEAGIKYGSMPLPQQGSRTVRTYVNYLMMSPASTNKAAAWTFIKWMGSNGQRLISTSGDYPANKGFNPVSSGNDIPDAVFQTLSVEKPLASPSLVIRDSRINKLYGELIRQVARGLARPADAARYFLEEARRSGSQGGN